MGKIIFITGGQRSGKSSYAQHLAESLSPRPVYVATARQWDDDFRQRIKLHQAGRNSSWRTIEEEKALHLLTLTGETVLLDCVTLWLTNIFHDNAYDLDRSVTEAKTIWNQFSQQDCTLIAVSNELGMGMHAADASSRRFADLQGWMNQHIAAQAAEAYAIVSGIPLKLK